MQAMLKQALEVPGTLDRLSNLPRSMAFDSTCTGTASFEHAANSVCDAIDAHLDQPDPIEA